MPKPKASQDTGGKSIDLPSSRSGELRVEELGVFTVPKQVDGARLNLGEE